MATHPAGSWGGCAINGRSLLSCPLTLLCCHCCRRPLQVYHADVTARLRERRLESDQDFEWLKVLRFYLEVRPMGGTPVARGGGAGGGN